MTARNDVHTLERLHEVAVALTATLELSAVLELIVEKALQVLNADIVVLYPYRQDENKFELPPKRAGSLVDAAPLRESRIRDEDIVGEVVQQMEPLYGHEAPSGSLLSLSEVDTSGKIPSFIERERIQSFAGVPLRVREETVGIMFVNYRTTQSFDDRQRRIIEVFANYAAIAIHNARVLEQRVAELEALAEIEKTITRHDLQSVLEKVLAAALQVTGGYHGNIFLVDESGKYLELAAGTGTGERTEIPERVGIGEAGVVAWVAHHREPVRISDVQVGEWKHQYKQMLHEMRFELAVPLLDEDNEVVGVINLESPRAGVFSEHNQRLVEALAKQAALAIQNAKRYQAERRARSELAALIEVDRAISSTLDLQKVLGLILDTALEITGAPVGTVMLVDAAKGELWMAAERGVSEEHKGARQQIGQGIEGLVAQTLEPVRVSDVTVQPWCDIYLAFIPNVRAELAVPLLADGELIGIINVESPEVAAFGVDDQRLLEALASQAVIAIRNAEIYEAMSEARQRMVFLYEFARRLIDAPLNVDHILDMALEAGISITGANAATALLWNEQLAQLEVRVRRGVPYGHDWEPIRSGEGLHGWVTQHRTTCVVRDVENPPPGIHCGEYLADTRSELVVPLLVGDNYFGNLDFGHPEKDGFDEQAVMVVESLANQVAAAIQRVEQQRELDTARQRELEAHVMASIGQSAMEIAHRLGNALGLVRSYVNEIRDEIGQDNIEVDARLDDIVRDVGSVLRLSQALKEELAHEREFPREKKRIPSQALLFETSRSYEVPPGVEIAIDCPETTPPVWADEHIFSAFANIFINAVQALSSEGGKVRLEALTLNAWVEFRISDTGCGIPEKNLSRVFDLFYTTKRDSFGFGLWSAKRIILANSGEILVDSKVGTGTTFTVRLPRGDVQ